MEKENLTVSISYLEFINNIDALVFGLLYSDSEGYTNLSSKEAVVNARKFLEKFDIEAEKLRKETNLENLDTIVEERKTELIKQIKKHYDEQTIVWADEVYNDMLDNCFFQASIHKDNKEITDKIYTRILSASSWVSNLHGLSDSELSELIKRNTEEFYRAMNSRDEDYIPVNKSTKTDSTVFLKIRNLITDNSEGFISLDLNNFQNKLSNDDIFYFNRLKNELQTYKINSVKDEIILVNTALDVLKIKNDDEKYTFIKQLDNDFKDFSSQNSKPDEEKKIQLVKRRMELFKYTFQKNRNFSTCEYFKNKITA